MPGIGNSANFAPLRTAAGSSRYFTSGMPCSGQGNPCARTSAPVKAARRAISCSRLSPPSIPIVSLFQSILEASGATTWSSDKFQQAVPIETRNAHPLCRPAIGGEIEAKKRLRDPHEGSSHRNVNIGDRCEGGERQQPVPEILPIIAVLQRVRRLDLAIGLP